MRNFKISVITIVYNGEDGLDATIRSVLNQTYKNIEYIVIDGGSTDDTISIIKKYHQNIDYWVSEKDRGIYEAMNKGVENVNGDFFVLLNSGDLFYNESSLAEMVKGISSPHLIYFGRSLVQSPFSSYFKPAKGNFDLIGFLRSTLPIHQSVLVPRALKYVKYDSSFKIAGDSAYLRNIFKQVPPVFLPIDMVIFNLGGVSSKYKNFRHFKSHLSEHLKVVWQYESNRISRTIYIVIAFSVKYIASKTMSEKKYYTLVRRFKRN